MKRKKIKSGWLEYFNFSARERRGTAFLSFIILLQIIFLSWLRNYQSPVIPPDPKLIKQILAFNDEHKSVSVHDTIIKSSPTISPFDPNKIDSTIALAAGLSSKQTKVILNYLSKGGVFRTKKDFSKMYCIPQQQFNKLEPYLLLPDSFIRSERKRPDRKSVLVDIATADSASLMQLRGIGPVFASRIVKYREKLGGFYSKDQLLEVYGMKDSLYNAISSAIVLNDTVPFRFVHLNTDSANVLASHPYIRWKFASLICSYRKQHPVISASDIKALPLVTDEIFRKLAPYLKTD